MLKFEITDKNSDGRGNDLHAIPISHSTSRTLSVITLALQLGSMSEHRCIVTTGTRRKLLYSLLRGEKDS